MMATKIRKIQQNVHFKSTETILPFETNQMYFLDRLVTLGVVRFSRKNPVSSDFIKLVLNKKTHF